MKEKELRDEIAMSVLPTIIKEQGLIQGEYGGFGNILYNNCQLAYKIADAMMDVRDGKTFYNRNRDANKEH